MVLLRCGDAGRNESSLRSVAGSHDTKNMWMTKKNQVLARQAEEATSAARNVCEELKKQIGMKSRKFSRDEGGEGVKGKVLWTLRSLLKDMKNCCEEEGLGLTFAAEHSRDHVRALELKKNGKQETQKKIRHSNKLT